MRSLLLASLVLAAMLLTSPSRAQKELPPILRTPANDPRRGPRLEFQRGPAQCPDEKTFRREVAYWADGVDHLAADSPDVVRVRLEWTAAGYRGVVEYTDAAGKTTAETVVQDGDHCPMLVRWVALAVSERIPPPARPPPGPEPPPCPAMTCPACPAAAPSRPYPRPPNPPEPSKNMPTLGVYGIAILTGGLTADPGAAFAAGIEVRGDPRPSEWVPAPAIALELRFALPGKIHAREAIVPDRPTSPRTFEAGQFTADLVPCARWKYLFGCGVIQAGFYYVEGTGYLSQSSASLALGPRLGIRVPVGDRFALFGFGEALFAPVRIGFAPLADPDPNVVWLPSVAQGYGAAGIEVTF